MNFKTLHFLLVLIGFSLNGYTQVTTNSNPPNGDLSDIYNYATSIGTQKFFTDSENPGQTFTTGDYDVELSSITLQTNKATEPIKSYLVRVGTLSGNTFTEIYSETIIQDVSIAIDDYITWSFANPVALNANTQYAFDIDMISSTTGWQTGIPYMYYSANDYAEGIRYKLASNGSITLESNSDFIFHLALNHGQNPIPEIGAVVPVGDVQLEWTNYSANIGTDVWVDIWFGTDPNNMTKVVDASNSSANLTTTLVNVPQTNTYYWRIDSYLDGNPNGTPSTGDLFHFSVFDLVALAPQNGETQIPLPDKLVATFNNQITPGTGNVIIKNLTSATQVSLPITDPLISFVFDRIEIHAESLMELNTSYAIHIDAGAIMDVNGESFAGILDDSTWTFTTNEFDYLVVIANELMDHINGTATLSGAQIASHYEYISSNRERLDETTEIITAYFDLIDTYETTYGPLFVAGSTILQFDRNNVSTEDIHWTSCSIMQLVFEEVFNKGSLSDPNKLALIDGYKFASSAAFPGAVNPPTNPNTSHLATLSASFNESFGRDTQHWGWAARKPTGTYLAPGSIVTVTVPTALVNNGYQIRVGAHTWDHEASNRRWVRRLSRASLAYDIDNTTMSIASPYGGGIYIDVPRGANAGLVNITITGAVRSPYFSAKNFHTTTNADWTSTERNHPAPWADFQTDKFMMQVPTSWIYALDDPTSLMAEWDAAMDAINSLMGFPHIRGKETMYLQVDVITRASVLAPGYPAVNVTYDRNGTYDGYQNNHLVRGPETANQGAQFHEQGHAYFFPRFANTNEAEVNLLYVAMANRALGMDLGKAFFRSYGPGDRISENQIDLTSTFWMTSFSFSPREDPMGAWEAAYQSQGYARYLDLVRLFGWQGLDDYWYSFNYDYENNLSSPSSNDDKLVRLCEKVGADVSPLWHFWGIHPNDLATVKSEIQALGLTPSIEVYNLLQGYKSIIPANNTEYQEFCLLWYDGEPSIGGAGAERERTRQFDSTNYWQPYGYVYAGTDPNQADGEIYTEATATRIHDRLQYIIDLYFDCADFNSVDADDDGICAIKDCDDNDANVGVQLSEGTACDDNDPLTENDKILADGCTCAGTIPSNCVDVDLKFMLEGPYENGSMNNDLFSFGTVPPQQPYNQAPWNYTGTEGDTLSISDYPSNSVDWVLISLRSMIDPSTTVWKTAAMLLNDGTLYFPNCLEINQIPIGVYYIVVEHRNHIGIMSPSPVDLANDKITYDFTLEDSYKTPTSSGQKDIGIWVMMNGDYDPTDSPSYDINGADNTIWKSENGYYLLYSRSDGNMDGDVNGEDKAIWKTNTGIFSSVPK